MTSSETPPGNTKKHSITKASPRIQRVFTVAVILKDVELSIASTSQLRKTQNHGSDLR